MKFGSLVFTPYTSTPSLLADATRASLSQSEVSEAYVAEIDPALSDTAAFCERYQIGLDVSANCVIVEAKRGDKRQLAACLILATDRADINGVVRRQLEARKISFAPMETATSLSGMEFGGITPIGLPEGWPILVDTAVTQAPWVIISSGVRRSKLLVPGRLLATLPGAVVLDIAKQG